MFTDVSHAPFCSRSKSIEKIPYTFLKNPKSHKNRQNPWEIRKISETLENPKKFRKCLGNPKNIKNLKFWKPLRFFKSETSKNTIQFFVNKHAHFDDVWSTYSNMHWNLSLANWDPFSLVSWVSATLYTFIWVPVKTIDVR